MVRRLIDDGMVLFLGIGGDGLISWIGRSSEQVLGRPAADLLGSSALDLIHPDDHGLVSATLAESARNADERILAVVRVQHANGSWLNLEFGGIDLRDDAGVGTFLVWGRSYESAHRLTALLDSLLTASDRSDLLRQVIEWCDALMPYSSTLVLARSDDGTYRAAAAANGLPVDLGTGLVVDEDTQGPWGLALVGRLPVQAEAGELSDVLAARAHQARIARTWVVAVPGGDSSKPDGLLVIWRHRPGPLLATHLRHIQEAARLCQLAFEWARIHADLVVAATTDSLTGVANRSQLRTSVDRDRSATAALLFCDLDRFKELNDRHGHAVGDHVLRAVAERLQGAIRSRDLLVRLGGDEFAVWCPDLRDRDGGESVAERILVALARPIRIEGRVHRVSCSIGIATASGIATERPDLEAILQRADQALYRAKAAGGARWERASG